MVNNKMKKTYIIPEALIVSLLANAPVLADTSVHDDEYGEEALVKEQGEVGTSSIGGGKSIWDEEW